MALEGFSKTFDLIELKKGNNLQDNLNLKNSYTIFIFLGYFPHEFNVPSNFNYVGTYPDKECYKSQ